MARKNSTRQYVNLLFTLINTFWKIFFLNFLLPLEALKGMQVDPESIRNATECTWQSVINWKRHLGFWKLIVHRNKSYEFLMTEGLIHNDRIVSFKQMICGRCDWNVNVWLFYKLFYLQYSCNLVIKEITDSKFCASFWSSSLYVLYKCDYLKDLSPSRHPYGGILCPACWCFSLTVDGTLYATESCLWSWQAA